MLSGRTCYNGSTMQESITGKNCLSPSAEHGKEPKGAGWREPCHGVLPASLSQRESHGACEQKGRNYIVKVANASVGFSMAPAGKAGTAGTGGESTGEGLGLAQCHGHRRASGIVLGSALSEQPTKPE